MSPHHVPRAAAETTPRGGRDVVVVVVEGAASIVLPLPTSSSWSSAVRVPVPRPPWWWFFLIFTLLAMTPLVVVAAAGAATATTAAGFAGAIAIPVVRHGGGLSSMSTTAKLSREEASGCPPAAALGIRRRSWSGGGTPPRTMMSMPADVATAATGVGGRWGWSPAASARDRDRPPRLLSSRPPGGGTGGGDYVQTSVASSPSFLDELSSRFSGDFDNYRQVLAEGLPPGEGGGHEHMHATLMPVTLPEHVGHQLFPPPEKKTSGGVDGASDVIDCGGDYDEHDGLRAVVAAYYLDALPDRLFRLRLYAMRVDDDHDEDEDEDVVRMKIFTFSPALFSELRGSVRNPELWGRIIDSHIREDELEGRSADKGEGEEEETTPPLVELEGCDVLWSGGGRYDPVRHSYLFSTEDDDDDDTNSSKPPSPALAVGDAYHAIMENAEGAVIPSMMIPGKMIRVQDELSMWENELWINDRGYDLETGDMTYGNRRGVPYKVRRVASFVVDRGDDMGVDDGAAGGGGGGLLRRKVVEPDLAWTLGEDWRSEGTYRERMEEIAIPSTAV